MASALLGGLSTAAAATTATIPPQAAAIAHSTAPARGTAHLHVAQPPRRRQQDRNPRDSQRHGT